MKALLLMIFAIALVSPLAWAKTIKLTVRVVGMQNHEAQYSYVVPGYSSSSGVVTQYGTPIREEYLIVYGGKLAGTGAKSYKLT